MASLVGALHTVARDWENDPDVRDGIRKTKSILQWTNPEDPKVNIKNAALNYGVLKPLVKRLCDVDTGVVGMHTLPVIQNQLLDTC